MGDNTRSAAVRMEAFSNISVSRGVYDIDELIGETRGFCGIVIFSRHCKLEMKFTAENAEGTQRER